MKPIVFSDLDDTLFQTARKMAEAPSEARLASVAKNGSHSYMTEAQEATLQWLVASTRLIPVTARSSEAMSRCTLPFDDFRVYSNGAVILDGTGQPDQEWQARTSDISARFASTLETLEGWMNGQNMDGQLYRHWIVEEFGLPIYFCVKSNQDEGYLDRVEGHLRAIAGPEMMFHRNGNNLSFTPAAISKRAAVEYLIEKIAEIGTPIWGMGDSVTDLPFMKSCQMMVIPTGSQVHNKMLGGA